MNGLNKRTLSVYLLAIFVAGVAAGLALGYSSGRKTEAQPPAPREMADHIQSRLEQRLGLTPEEVATLHAGAAYYVDFIGFTPGLPYLSGLPEALHIPRLEQPRVKTPPGSVSIGGMQCCIYSVESPGGFWVLGRTPVPLYDPSAADPILLRAGDHVRFRRIDRSVFVAIITVVAAGSYRPIIEAAAAGS